jgi:hypothetical protein
MWASFGCPTKMLANFFSQSHLLTGKVPEEAIRVGSSTDASWQLY